MPSLGAGQSPCPTGGFQGGFGPISGQASGWGYGRDEEQEKPLALLCARADTTARSAGGFREQGLTLFRNAQTTIDAVSRETDEYPRRCGTCADAITDLGGI